MAGRDGAWLLGHAPSILSIISWIRPYPATKLDKKKIYGGTGREKVPKLFLLYILAFIIYK